VLSVMQVRSS